MEQGVFWDCHCEGWKCGLEVVGLELSFGNGRALDE